MSMDSFKELVQFMIYECRDNPRSLGAIRLNKALWFTDMLAYQATGESISGVHYVKRKMGPAPRPIVPVLRELEEHGLIRTEEPKFQYAPRLYFHLVEPQFEHLSQDDRAFAKLILDYVRDTSADEISEETHDEIWKAAQEGEDIPLYATLASGTGEITDDVRLWAESCVQGFGLEERG